MIQEVKRSYLQIKSIIDLKETPRPSKDYSINLLDSINFQLNKFFYKKTISLFKELVAKHDHIPLEIEISTFTSWK